MAWRDRLTSQTGFVFRAIGNGENLKTGSIRPNQVNVMTKTIAKDCQLSEVQLYSSHSMRRGAMPLSDASHTFGLSLDKFA
jgi:hypothetical protein